MPELPEVETVKAYVYERVLHKKIKNIKVLDKKLRWPIDTKKIGKAKSKTIKLVTRRGKYILLPLSPSPIEPSCTRFIYPNRSKLFKKSQLII